MMKSRDLEDLLAYHLNAADTIRKTMTLMTHANGALHRLRGLAHPPVVTPKRKRRAHMSAAARKAVSIRMKKYWAGRRRERREARA